MKSIPRHWSFPCLGVALGLAFLGCKDSATPNAGTAPQPSVVPEADAKTDSLHIDAFPESSTPKNSSDSASRQIPATQTAAAMPSQIPGPFGIAAAPSAPSNRSDGTASAAYSPDDAVHRSLLVPFLNRHCLKCHGPNVQKGDFRVDEHLPNDFLSRSSTEKWSEVLNMLNAGEMPPEGESRPSATDVQKVAEWIEHERLRAERARNDRAVVLRRMNREEYNNTIRDLIGIDVELVEGFPEDPPAGGFDNNGGALTISPMHLELYLKAAKTILDRALVDESQGPGTIKWRFELKDGRRDSGRRVHLDDHLNGNVLILCGDRPRLNGMVRMRHPDEPWTGVQNFTLPRPGRYVIRIRAAGLTPPEPAARKAGPEFHERRQRERENKITDEAERRKSREAFEQWIIPYVRKHFEEDRRYRYGPPRLRVTGYLRSSQRVLGEIDVTAPLDKPVEYEFPTLLEAESAKLQVSNQYRIPDHWYLAPFGHHDEFPRPELFIDWIEIEGPLYDHWPPSSHTRILIDSQNKGRDEVAYAREVLAHFMRRAYRRPLRKGEIQPLLARFEQVRPEKPSFVEAIKLPLTAILVSPHFLYLVEEGNPGLLNDHPLASRLSYFLWSSMPDEELSHLAEAGTLNKPETLRAQVDRMLADARSEALVKNFAGQWLGLRKVGFNPPVAEIYPRYDDHLEFSMRGETEAFFAHILHNDRSVLEFLSSDYVTINERLARFYDIPGVSGDEFRSVVVPAGMQRGGLVTQASILSMTSNGTRTSPVWRGVWVLENLLGDPPPPPPPNAGDIPAGVPGLDKTTVRERLKLHRAQPECARCHNKIDPLGFALENFAANGEWREREAKQYMFSANNPNDPAIDASARMPDGTVFQGVDGLRRELLKRENQFLRCLSKKMYTYVLGRELGYADEPVIDAAVAYVNANDKTLRSLLHHIVVSDTFRTK